MSFEQQLRAYARVLVRIGMNVQEGQIVRPSGEIAHRELLYLIAEESYEAGARFVDVMAVEPRLGPIRVRHQPDRDLVFSPSYMSARGRELVQRDAAILSLVGKESPDLYDELNPQRVQRYMIAQQKTSRYLRQKGILPGRIAWTVAAAATPAWAKKVFPEQDESAATALLWECIFRFARADATDPLAAWKEHLEQLNTRSQLLNELAIETLHFSGGGIDLSVGLSPRAIFIGGSKENALGVPFVANIPTEEIFSTPDWRKTEGVVRSTRPFSVNQQKVSNLEVEFEKGEVVRFSANEGEETFAEFLKSDTGSKRLGEVSLVSCESPIYQSGLVFEEILFDENAACHIAFGAAYPMCIEGSENMSPEDLAKVGFNTSIQHNDMMISSESTNVEAILRSGCTIPIITKGKWINNEAVLS